jgi:membrane protein YqaA with SNARE-associated domain
MLSLANIEPVSQRSSLTWLIHLGGPGLILLGLADNAGILPGSMDILTILLAAHRRDIWFYYAIMATVGAITGGYLTYRVALKGGKATLEKKFSQQTVDKVYAKFERWGFGAVAIPALFPPPFPMVLVLLSAGAMRYPRNKFLTALAMGRGVRYTILAFLGAHYGRHIVRFFSQYYKPALLVLITLAVLGGGIGLAQYYRSRKRSRSVAGANTRELAPHESGNEVVRH